MSTNFHIEAQREITVKKTGKTDLQVKKVEVWQTPTEVTYQIMRSESPIEAYFAWVESISEDVEEPVYAEDDVWCERQPIGHQIYNEGKEHVAKLRSTIAQLEADGWDVVFEAW